MAGYSGTPLAKKLGIKEGFRVLAVGAPTSYRALLEPLPASVRFVSQADASVDLAHCFAKEKSALAAALKA